jgi:hypothetical protein
MASNLVKTLLVDGLEDLITFGTLYSRVLEEQGQRSDDVAIQSRCLEAVRELLASGLVVIGDPHQVGGKVVLESWGLGPDQAVERIRNRWPVLRKERTFAGEAWMELTSHGREVAIASRSKGGS